MQVNQGLLNTVAWEVLRFLIGRNWEGKNVYMHVTFLSSFSKNPLLTTSKVGVLNLDYVLLLPDWVVRETEVGLVLLCCRFL